MGENRMSTRSLLARPPARDFGETEEVEEGLLDGKQRATEAPTPRTLTDSEERNIYEKALLHPKKEFMRNLIDKGEDEYDDATAKAKEIFVNKDRKAQTTQNLRNHMNILYDDDHFRLHPDQANIPMISKVFMDALNNMMKEEAKGSQWEEKEDQEEFVDCLMAQFNKDFPKSDLSEVTQDELLDKPPSPLIESPLRQMFFQMDPAEGMSTPLSRLPSPPSKMKPPPPKRSEEDFTIVSPPRIQPPQQDQNMKLLRDLQQLVLQQGKKIEKLQQDSNNQDRVIDALQALVETQDKTINALNGKILDTDVMDQKAELILQETKDTLNEFKNQADIHYNKLANSNRDQIGRAILAHETLQRSILEAQELPTKVVEESKKEIREAIEKNQTEKLYEKLSKKLKKIVDERGTQLVKGISSATVQGHADHQLRVFEQSLERSRRNMHAQVTTAIEAVRKKSLSDVTAHTKSACRHLDDRFDELQNVVIQNLDAAPAEYDKLKEEFVINCRKELSGKLLEQYNEYKATTCTMMDHIFNKHMDEKEKSLQDKLEEKVDKLVNDEMVQARIRSTMDYAVEDIEKDMMKTTEEMKQSLIDGVEKFDITVTAENIRAQETAREGRESLEALAAVLRAEFEEKSEILKGQLENVEANKDEKDRRKKVRNQKKNKKKREKKKQQAQSPLKMFIKANGDPGDGDDSSSSSSSSSDDDSTPGSNNGTPRTPTNFAVAKKTAWMKNISKMDENYSKVVSTFEDLNKDNAEEFYHSVHRLLHRNNLPMIKFDDLTAEYTTSVPTEKLEEMNDIDLEIAPLLTSTLYAKLREQFDDASNTVKQILQVHSTTRDGYKTIYDLMQMFCEQLNPYTNRRWGPTWQQGTSPRGYADQLLRTAKLNKDREYTEVDLMVEFVLQSKPHNEFHNITTAFVTHMDIHGTNSLKKYSFLSMVRLYAYVGNPSIRTTTDDEDLQRIINKMTTPKPKRGWAKHSVQCPICHQYGHSPEKDHICYFSGQLFHTLSHMHLLDKSKIPMKELKLHEENAKRYTTYNIPHNINKLVQMNIDIDSMDHETLAYTVAQQDLQRTPMIESDFP